jgi:hypothetical protein
MPPSPPELREKSRLLREAADRETNLSTKQKLAERALELAVLAERIERQEGNF